MQGAVMHIPDVFEFHPEKKSDKLIVYFSSASAKTIEGVKQLSRYKENKLFIRDPDRNWYNGNIEGLADGPDQLAERIKEVVKRFDKKNITFAGSSMGAYAAILFGALLEIPNIAAIAPQIVIHPLLPNSPREVAKFSDLAVLLRALKRKSTIRIWFGCGELLDVYQSMRCHDIPGCQLFGVPDSLHNVLAHLKSLDLVNEFYDTVIEGKPIDLKFADIAGIPLPEICEALDKNYLENDPVGSNRILKQLSHPLLAGALAHQIGSNHKKASENEDAITALTEAVKINPANYDAFFSLAGTHLAMGNFNEAIRHYKSAIAHFPGKNIDYVTQLSGAYRLNKEFNPALIHIYQALQMGIPYPKTLHFAGLIYRDMGRDEEAIRYFSDALKLQPGFKAASDQLSYVIGRYYAKDLRSRFDIDAHVSAKLA